ncbi:MAG: hypothetical protein AB7K64_09565 [Variibacter sp.]
MTELKKSREKLRAKAHRDLDSQLRSGWEHGYREPIMQLRLGRPSRVIDLLRARRALSGDEFELLADAIEVALPQKRLGRRPDEGAQEAARLATLLLANKQMLPVAVGQGSLRVATKSEIASGRTDLYRISTKALLAATGAPRAEIDACNGEEATFLRVVGSPKELDADEIVEQACKSIEQTSGKTVNRKLVRSLLARPRKRRGLDQRYATDRGGRNKKTDRR